jgi:hypothetical protein
MSKRGLFIIFAVGGVILAALGLSKASQRIRRPSFLV